MKILSILYLILTLSACQLVNTDVVPTSGTRIAVTVRMRSNNSLVEGATVSLYQNPTTNSCNTGLVRTATTKADGKAYFGSLDANTYYSIRVTKSNLKSDCASQKTERDVESNFSMDLY